MRHITKILLLLASAALPSLHADPLLNSWRTETSGSYARIYPTLTEQNAQTPVTTWSRGDGVQTNPTYAGVHEISYTENWLYIRTTNLASHIMGPWYRNEAKTNLFGNYPANQATIYRFPRNPVDPTTIAAKTLTGGGSIGYFVNGVSMYDSRDANSYNSSSGEDAPGGTGDRTWNRDAYVNESVTFDPGNAHQAGSRYHYHANPPALRHQLGDSVDYDPSTNTYTENFNGRHSPILAWARDGLPIYGPYAYSDPLDPDSPIRRMISGYQIRTDNTRASWPAWATRVYDGIRAFVAGPAISNQFPLGRYMEDNDYKGDLGMTLGDDFDLNEYNVRFCITPEFPAGTWAYFVCIDETGTPLFPYNISRAFFGDPVGDDASSIPDADELNAPLTTHFKGGPEAPIQIQNIERNDSANQVTLTWTPIDGGIYQVLENEDPTITENWVPVGTQQLSEGSPLAQTIDLPANASQSFQRIRRANVLPFDDAGFNYELAAPSNPGDPVSVTVSFDGNPIDVGTLPSTLSFNGQAIDISNANVVRNDTNQITFDTVIYGLAPGDYALSATFPGEPLRSGTYTIHSNILLLILDDWGIDSSPLHNDEPEVDLAKMPHLEELASQGLLFNRAYSQPLCSPMRATMLTGRQVFQHKVGSPQNAGNFSNGREEITLPEIFTTMNAPHAMLTVGKWHLGGNDNGYSNRGGWPEFYGINGGGVQSYYEWDKNSNGTTSVSATYSTTDQVNHATTFIENKTSTGTPWFAWVAFNAPHSPFEAPPAELAPEGGYSTQAQGESNNKFNYRRTLEALDTELGRLLESVDPAQTNIILLGDNGTPGQTVQAPFGNGNAKGDLYNGGIHVPMIAKGPAVKLAPGSETETLVHCIDVFSTILELAGIDESQVPNLDAQNVLSTSMVPIWSGTDTAERYIAAERNDEEDTYGRAVIMGTYPNYKLIINGNPDSTVDTPTFEFYKVDTDPNEQSPLDLENLSPEAQLAYEACLAKDQQLGGGYSDPAQ